MSCINVQQKGSMEEQNCKKDREELYTGLKRSFLLTWFGPTIFYLQPNVKRVKKM